MREITLDGSPSGVAELTRALSAALDGTGPAVLPLDASRSDMTALRAALRPDLPVEPGIATIIVTSGSTGDAKGVLLSGDALRASAEATHARLGGPGRWLLATPAQYIGGLQVLVRSLLTGTAPGMVDLSVPFRADGFADAAEAVIADSGPRYTAIVPTQLARLLDEGGRGLAALRAFDAVIIGAAATSSTLRDRAEQAGVRAVPSYGMSETASGCVYDGIPLDGVRLRLADQNGDGVGRIELAGPVLASGYRNRPDLTEAVFAGGWFTTGDAGRLRPDGRLEVLGRVDDLINTGGVKVVAAVVERILTGCAGVAETCVIGLPDEHWGQQVAALVVPREPASPPDPAVLRQAVRDQAGRAAVPKVLRFADRLPVRGPGKPDRTAVRDLLTS